MLMLMLVLVMMVTMMAANCSRRNPAPNHFDINIITLTCLHTVSYRFNMPFTTTNQDSRMHVESPHRDQSNVPVKSARALTRSSQIITYTVLTYPSQIQIRTFTCFHQSNVFVKSLHRISTLALVHFTVFFFVIIPYKHKHIHTSYYMAKHGCIDDMHPNNLLILSSNNYEPNINKMIF